MAFGADDEEAAVLDDFVVFGLALCAKLGVAILFHLERLFVGDGFVGFAKFGDLLAGQKFGVAAEEDVGAASGHVGGDGDGPFATRLGDDGGLGAVVFGVEDGVGDFFLAQDFGDDLAFFDADGADEAGLTVFVAGFNLVNDCGDFVAFAFVDEVGVVDADGGFIGGDDEDFEVVSLLKLFGFGVGGAGHACEFFVHAEVVLEGDGGEGFAFVLDFDTFLGFDGLVEAIGPAATRHGTASKFIDDNNFALINDVVNVFFVERVGLESFVNVVEVFDILGFVEVLDFEIFLKLFKTFIGEGDRVVFFVDDVVFVFLEERDDFVDFIVKFKTLFDLARNDERCTRFINQDRVNLIHNRKEKIALRALSKAIFHVIAEIIKAEFVVGTVSYIRRIGALALGVRQVRQDLARRHPKRTIKLTHPVSITRRQVVIHRNEVRTFASEGVEVKGASGHQRLALTRLHFSNAAFMQSNTANDLDIIMTHAENPTRHLTRRRKRFGQEAIKGLAVCYPLLKFSSLGGEGRVVEFGEGGLKGFDLVHKWLDAAKLTFVFGSKNPLDQVTQHGVYIRSLCSGSVKGDRQEQRIINFRGDSRRKPKTPRCSHGASKISRPPCNASANLDERRNIVADPRKSNPNKSHRKVRKFGGLFNIYPFGS